MLSMEKDSIDPDLKLMIACVIGFVMGMAVPLAPIIANVSVNPRYDSYSLTLTAVDGFGRPAAGESPLSPAFNLKLHVENSRFIWENCFSHGAVAASYNGVAMGEGRVPGWCTGARSTTEVEVLLRGKDVQLPDGLRRRMEAELRWGTAELDVEATLFRDDEQQAPVLLRCKAVGPQVPPQPLECKVFTDFTI